MPIQLRKYRTAQHRQVWELISRPLGLRDHDRKQTSQNAKIANRRAGARESQARFFFLPITDHDHHHHWRLLFNTNYADHRIVTILQKREARWRRQRVERQFRLSDASILLLDLGPFLLRRYDLIVVLDQHPPPVGGSHLCGLAPDPSEPPVRTMLPASKKEIFDTNSNCLGERRTHN